MVESETPPQASPPTATDDTEVLSQRASPGHGELREAAKALTVRRAAVRTYALWWRWTGTSATLPQAHHGPHPLPSPHLLGSLLSISLSGSIVSSQANSEK